MPKQSGNHAEALFASFGVSSVREVFTGPAKIVVDGVVPLKNVRCSAALDLPSGIHCACPNCDPEAFDEFNDEDAFDFE